MCTNHIRAVHQGWRSEKHWTLGKLRWCGAVVTTLQVVNYKTDMCCSYFSYIEPFLHTLLKTIHPTPYRARVHMHIKYLLMYIKTTSDCIAFLLLLALSDNIDKQVNRNNNIFASLRKVKDSLALYSVLHPYKVRYTVTDCTASIVILHCVVLLTK